jgi:hypothetical protein
MKPEQRLPLLIAIAMLILAASFILPRFTTLPDIVNGFLRGFSIAILVIAIFKQVYVKVAKKY